MPIQKAAFKALRQAKKATIKNLRVKRNLKAIVKKSRKEIKDKTETAAENVKKAIKALDKAAQKNLIKKNTAARLKSRLMTQLNKIKKK